MKVVSDKKEMILEMKYHLLMNQEMNKKRLYIK